MTVDGYQVCDEMDDGGQRREKSKRQQKLQRLPGRPDDTRTKEVALVLVPELAATRTLLQIAEMLS